jgi:hypothetical protein
MTNKQIGGRGKKAPYETTHVRIPVDLKPQVELLIEEFRNNGFTIDNQITNNPSINSSEFIKQMIEEFKNNNMLIIQETNDISDDKIMSYLNLKLEESVKLANKLLATRATKKEVVNKLLTALFGIEVEI